MQGDSARNSDDASSGSNLGFAPQVASIQGDNGVEEGMRLAQANAFRCAPPLTVDLPAPVTQGAGADPSRKTDRIVWFPKASAKRATSDGHPA